MSLRGPNGQVTELHNAPLISNDNTDNTNQEGTSSCYTVVPRKPEKASIRKAGS
jgi:hypothetical protein